MTQSLETAEFAAEQIPEPAEQPKACSAAVDNATPQQAETPTPTLSYLLARMDQVLNDTQYIQTTIAALQNISVTGPGDMANAERAEALSDVVKCRETTNQKLLGLYEKMYEDIRYSQKTVQEKVLDLLNKTLNNATLTQEEKELAISALDEIRHLTPAPSSLQNNLQAILQVAKSVEWEAYPAQVRLAISEGIKAQLARNY